MKHPLDLWRESISTTSTSPTAPIVWASPFLLPVRQQWRRLLASSSARSRAPLRGFCVGSCASPSLVSARDMRERAGATAVAAVAADARSGDDDDEALIPRGGCCRGASTGVGAGGREELLLAGGGGGEGPHGAPWARAGRLTKLRVARAPRDEGGCAGRPFLPIYLRPGSWQRRGGGRGVVSKAGVGARHGCQT